MKNKFLFAIAFGSLFLTYSCAPVYKCGEEKPAKGVAGSNRLLDVVKERDELCDLLDSKDQETAYLVTRNQALTFINDSLETKIEEVKTEYNTLKGEHNQLGKEHTALKKEHLSLSQNFSDEVSKNLSQGHLYDERLKEKERRLQLREDDLTALEKEVQAREGRIHELESELARQDSIAKRMNQLLHEALLGFNSDELTTEVKNGKVYVLMSDKLMFQSGKADVQAKGKDALKALADVLKKNTGFTILVEGHTDNVPIKTARYKDNWDLSVDRATSIVRILQDDYKVDPLSLTASGRGEFYPRADNNTASGKAKNRRTEIILSPNLTELMEMIGK
ncbi:MAG TPA: OmpA family protein [Brumimicrobium sp.]|nr:OmpA family protein [Brumimicrobium sp.]